jgi:hypothetical protein
MKPAWTIPKEERDIILKTTNGVGPGMYNLPDVELTHEQFPKWTIKGKYPWKPSSLDVGPGQYKNPDYVDKGPSFSMQSRGQVSKKDENPGPGAYNLPSQKSEISCSIKGRIEGSKPQSESVGPGMYKVVDVGVNREQAPKWSLSGKGQEMKVRGGPGPGQYEVNRKMEDKGTIISPPTIHPAHLPPDPPTSTLGPGQYNPQPIHLTTSVTINGRPQPPSSESPKPGPGQYSLPKCSVNHEEFPKWSIQGKGKVEKTEVCPGPGYYSNPDYKDEGMAYTFQGRDVKEKINDDPGPGYYNPIGLKGPEGFTLKGKIVLKEKVNENPGPGYYNAPKVEINHEEWPKWTIPSKYYQKEKDVGPGPGQYRTDSPKDKNKGITIKQRYEKHEKVDDIPGPGNYNIKVPPGHPGITIGERNSHPVRLNEVPGPGNYNAKLLDGNPKWTIKGRHPRETSQEPTPGPGHYKNPDYDGKGVAYTIKGRNSLERVDENPGPGAYNIKAKKGNEITMGKKFEKIDKTEITPGPGNYNSRTTLTHIGHKIGKSIRSELKANDIPGPGSYNDKRKGNPYKGKFGTSKREAGKKLDVPGPGSYNVQAPKGPEGPKIQTRYPDSLRNDNPGPAHYAFRVDKYRGPSFTIGEKRRRRSLDDGPAPNHYVQKDDAVRNNSPRCLFGRSSRKSRMEISNIGPGYYNQRSYLKEGPSHSMGRRLKSLLDSCTPGPGQYNLQYKRPKSAKSNMSLSQRLTTADNSVPGPGMYNHTVDSGKSVTFSKSKRRSQSAPRTPGPGSYHIPSWNDDTGRSILERHDEKLRENYPGPGMYDIKLPVGLSYSISGHAAVDFAQKERMNNPPPNIYNLDDKSVRERIKGGNIGKSGRATIDQDLNPGPGHYAIYDVNAKRKGITIGEKLEAKDKNEYPGPGQYSHRIIKFKNTAYSVGTGRRSDMILSDAPGPGSYIIEEESGKGVIIPMSAKMIEKDTEKVPGPGYYSNMYDKDYQGKGVTIGIKFLEKDKEYFPGPGQYPAKNANNGPSFTIAKKYKQKANKTRENDRFYDTEQSHKVTQCHEIHATIGKSKRKTLKENDAPGPGQYSNKDNSKGPSYTIGQKHIEKIDQSLVNSKFYKVEEGIKFTKRHTPSAIIGDSKRIEVKTDNFPGPGYYVNPEKEKGPKYTIARRYKDISGI